MAFLRGLAHRDRIPEMMDDPGLDSAAHQQALRGLARINWLTGAVGMLWRPIRDLSLTLGRPVRLLDVATGSGDVPAGLMAQAERERVILEVSGCDVSPTAVAVAAANCPVGRFFVHDVVRDPLPDEFDVVMCSLFLHHLSTEDVTLVLERMKAAARHLVAVSDLARSRFNYISVALSCRLLTRSTVVHFDGPASVRSAFTPLEALALAERAGLMGATVRHRFPCRFVLTWRKDI